MSTDIRFLLVKPLKWALPNRYFKCYELTSFEYFSYWQKEINYETKKSFLSSLGIPGHA